MGYKRRRYKTDPEYRTSVLQSCAKYKQTERGKKANRQAQAKWRAKQEPNFRRQDAQKTKARRKVEVAVRTGALVPVASLQCECGAQATGRHHHDYDKPFDTKAVCRKCHAALHN